LFAFVFFCRKDVSNRLVTRSRIKVIEFLFPERTESFHQQRSQQRLRPDGPDGPDGQNGQDVSASHRLIDQTIDCPMQSTSFIVQKNCE
jgi:hypothetical protein